MDSTVSAVWIEKISVQTKWIWVVFVLKKRGEGVSQKFVLPYIVTFAIVSRYFENKNNNYCETKMPFVY